MLESGSTFPKNNILNLSPQERVVRAFWKNNAPKNFICEALGLDHAGFSKALKHIKEADPTFSKRPPFGRGRERFDPERLDLKEVFRMASSGCDDPEAAGRFVLKKDERLTPERKAELDQLVQVCTHLNWSIPKIAEKLGVSKFAISDSRVRLGLTTGSFVDKGARAEVKSYLEAAAQSGRRIRPATIARSVGVSRQRIDQILREIEADALIATVVIKKRVRGGPQSWIERVSDLKSKGLDEDKIRATLGLSHDQFQSIIKARARLDRKKRRELMEKEILRLRAEDRLGNRAIREALEKQIGVKISETGLVAILVRLKKRYPEKNLALRRRLG